MKLVKSFKDWEVLFENRFIPKDMSKDEYDKAILKIRKAISRILVKYTFFGTMLIDIPLATSSECNGMATDGTIIIFNPKYVLGLKEDQIIFDICHNLLHNGLGHFGKRESRDPDLWNLSCDLEINPLLMGVGEPTPSAPGIKQLEGMDAEGIYDILNRVSRNIKTEHDAIVSKISREIERIPVIFDGDVYDSGSIPDSYIGEYIHGSSENRPEESDELEKNVEKTNKKDDGKKQDGGSGSESGKKDAKIGDYIRIKNNKKFGRITEITPEGEYKYKEVTKEEVDKAASKK